MARKIDPSEKIIKATLKLAAVTPWREISMADIAEAAKVKPDLLAEKFSSKLAILDAFNKQIDGFVAKGFVNTAPEETIRDQLFDILMARFDALLPHKKAIKSILRETVPYDPIATASGLGCLIRSMRRVLELAGLSSLSPIGCLKTKALLAIYLNSFKTWLVDESADMAKTMVSLDNGLAKAERLANFIPSPPGQAA
jgi:AcrR family transcriptional regulator